MADLPSTIGRYEIVSRLGQGGMGSLFLARDPKIGRLVAIKLVRQEFDSPDARQRFAREAQSAGTLRHQNIVTIFDVDEHEGLPFIAMEYIDGQTLGEIVRRKAQIDLLKRLQWIEDLCGALAYAHRQGVIHRDIKPANLMVDTEGTLKILDFGLARRDASTFTQTQTLIGTPNYMSPEQIKGGDIDTRSDIFSVGSVLYEILAYQPAFPGSVHQAMHKILNEAPVPIETIVPGLDPRVGAVIQRALEKDVERRYPDLTIMKHDLAGARLPSAHDQPDTMRVSREAASSGRASVNQSGARFSPESLQRRRNEQIEKKLEEARARFEAGLIDKARAACEEALFIDPQLPAALRLMADITAEVEKRHVAVYVGDARLALANGELDLATAKANEALALMPTAPDVILLLDAIESASREQARIRQIQDAIARAQELFAEGSFESVVRIAAEVLALDGDNAAATELQARALEDLEAIRLQTEREQQAEAVMADARALRDRGQRDEAIARLAAFPHPHADVAALLESIRIVPAPAPPAPPPPPVLIDESIFASFRNAHPEPQSPVPEPIVAPEPVASPVTAAPPATGAPPPPASAAAAVPEVPVVFPLPAPVDAPPARRKPEAVTAATVGPAARPAWQGIAAAAVALIAAGSVAVVMMGGGRTAAPVTPTPPAVTTPPPSQAPSSAEGRPANPSRPINDAVKKQNDDDSMVAYQHVLKSRLDDATALLDAIRKRDPSYEGLKDLEATIKAARDAERATLKKPGI